MIRHQTVCSSTGIVTEWWSPTPEEIRADIASSLSHAGFRGESNYATEAARARALEELYHQDGRDNPFHPDHSTFSGLMQKAREGVIGLHVFFPPV